MLTFHTVLQLITIALVLSAFRRKDPMNQAEQDEFAKLNTKIDASIAAHKETNEALAKSQADLATANATVADLTAKLAAVGDGSDVIAAVAASEAKLDAENAPPVAPDAPPAS